MATPRLDIDALSVEERISLMEDLWESLTHAPEAMMLSAEQEAELDRRLDEIERGDHTGEAWESVRASLRKKFE